MADTAEPRIIHPDKTQTLFLLRHRFQRSQAEFIEYYEEHRAFVEAQIAAGRMLSGGPTVPWDGGVILIVADSRAEAERFVAADPIAQKGLTEYDITEWKTTTRADDFTALVQQHREQVQLDTVLTDRPGT